MIKATLLVIFALFKWLPSPAEGSLFKTLGRGLKNPLTSPYNIQSLPSHCTLPPLGSRVGVRTGTDDRYTFIAIYIQFDRNHFRKEFTLSIPFLVFPSNPIFARNGRSME
jgi:hypothetical protein